MCDHRNTWLPWCDSVYHKQDNAASVTVNCAVPMKSPLISSCRPRLDVEETVTVGSGRRFTFTSRWMLFEMPQSSEHADGDAVLASNLIQKSTDLNYSKTSYKEFLDARGKILETFAAELCEGGARK